jgi:phenylacetate-CoA ligase
MSECYPFILKHFILPVAEIIRGMPVQKFLKEMEELEFWSPGQIREFQLLKLRKLLTHSYETVPYYHELFDNSGLQPSDIESLEDLTKIPFLTKEIIRKNPFGLISRGG